MSRGFTLIEVVMALTLFGLVGLAGAALLESAARSAREAEFRERLLWVSGTVLDSLRAQDVWSAGERSLPGVGRVVWSHSRPGGSVEVWPDRWVRPWVIVPVGHGVPHPSSRRAADG